MNNNVSAEEGSIFPIGKVWKTIDQKFVKVPPDGLLAHFFLALVGTAGILYINIIPVLIGGLVDELAFSKQQAGYVASANLYGASLGAFLAVFLVRRVSWQKLVSCMLVVLIAFDTVSALLTSAEPLMVFRFFAGVVGGIITGTGFSVIARTSHADRGFGFLMVVQYLLGGVGMLLLPGVVDRFGHEVLFYTLAAFSCITLITMPFHERDATIHSSDSSVASQSLLSLLKVPTVILTMLAIIFFQSSIMGLFTYLERMGIFHDLSRDWVGLSLAMSSWVGIPCSILMIYLATRFTRKYPLFISIAVAYLGLVLCYFSSSAVYYFVACILVGGTWGIALAYLFGLSAELDKTGQLAVVASISSKLGLASGPLVSATIIANNNYDDVITLAIIGITASVLLMLYPVFLLDSKNKPAH